MFHRMTGGVYLIDRPCLENAMRIDMGAAPMVSEMNRHGFLIDTSHLTTLSSLLAEHYERHLCEIEALVGKRINPGSSDQVAQLLFRDLKLQLPGCQVILTATGQQSTDADTLNLLLPAHPVVKPILDARGVAKLKDRQRRVLPGGHRRLVR